MCLPEKHPCVAFSQAWLSPFVTEESAKHKASGGLVARGVGLGFRDLGFGDLGFGDVGFRA